MEINNLDRIVYRYAALDDLDAIIALRAQEQSPERASAGDVRHYLVNGVTVVAELDGRIIGFRYGERFCGDIFAGTLFIVDHAYRAHGVGTKLSKFMFDELRKQGYRLAITGNSDYYPPMYGAVEGGKWHRPTELYLRLGYELVAETELSRLFVLRLDDEENSEVNEG